MLVLQVSHEAAQILGESRKEEGIPENFGVRVYAEPTTEGGAAVRLAFVEDPEAGDEVNEQHGTKIYVSPELSEPLSEAFIDAESREGDTKLVLKGPGLGA